MTHARKRLSSRGGFAIYLGMAITALLMVVGVSLVEKLYPASKNVKGIEQGNMAYYAATSAVERAMLSLTGSNPALEPADQTGSTATTGFKYRTSASGTVIPNPGSGNSEFSPDKKWNLLALGRPAQFRMPAGTNIGGIKFEFRAPDVDTDNVFKTDAGGGFLSRVTTNWISSFTQSLEQQVMLDQGATSVAVNENDYGTDDLLKGGTGVAVNWVVSAGTGVLLSTEASAISFDMVNVKPNGTNGGQINFGTLNGKLLDGTDQTVQTFSNNNCALQACTIKLAIVNPPILANDVGVPYIEYRLLSPSTTVPLPQQWIRITAEGYERGYRQSVTRNVRQITTGEAMDFTVFQ